MTTGSDNREDFRPTAAWQTLKQRAAITRRIRAFFDQHGYTEVQTPLLSHDIVVDAHLEPFTVETDYGTLFLQTSPEFAMKRLLCDGADSIYQLCHAFRQGEVGTRHNPEFTMLEWYKVGDTYHDQMTFTEELVRTVLSDTISSETFPRTTYNEAFHRACGTTVLDLSANQLIALATEHNIALPSSLDQTNCDDLLNLILSEVVEPTLGQQAPEFLYDYPASQSALAKVRDDEPPVAERFELYHRGIELCNGYQELTDANELADRNVRQNQLRVNEGHRPLPTDSRLLSAMHSGFPDCSGVALGVDRLVALALGLERLDQVWPFPIRRA